MTWILILLCLAIAGRELYLAFDRRLPEAQQEIRELQDKVAELSSQVVEQQREPEPEEIRPEEPAEPADVPVAGPLARQTPPAVREAPESAEPRKASAAAAVSAALIRRLESELGETSARLAALEHELAVVRESETAQARSLDAVEQTVGTLYREMISRLEHEHGAARGLLFAEESAIEPILTSAFEHCLSENGLRVRAKEPTPGSPWYTGYLLSGDRPAEEVAERLLAQARALLSPDDPSALCGLLTELAALRGSGVARVGSFTAVRTPTWVACGVLPAEPSGSDPMELAARLEGLAETQRWDPAWFGTTG